MPDDPTIPDATCPPFAGASARDLLAGILLASGGDPANIPNTTQCREWGYGRYTERDLLAAILLAIESGGVITNPGVAYVRTDGNDGTAQIGNPAKPYLTATAAFAALKALLNSTSLQHAINLGVGDFELDMTTAEVAAGYQIFVVGEGGSVDTTGMNGSTLTINVDGAEDQSVPVLLITRSNLSVKFITNIVANGIGNLSGNIYAWATNMALNGSMAGGSNSLTAHGNFCVLSGAANYGAVAGCYVDGVFDYT
jgi:hypothetical protein